jgi:DNA-binding CsgD family transcriptional regulator
VRWTVYACLFAYRWAGRLRDMEALAASEYERAVQLHNSQAQGVAVGSLGWVSLAQGQLMSATSRFRESVAVLDDADLTATRSLSLAGLIEALALAGDPDGAEATMAELVNNELPITREIAPRVAISQAWVLAARGELGRAVEEFMAAASAARAGRQVFFEILALHSALRLGELQVAPRLVAMSAWVQGPIIQAAALHAEALAAGNGIGLEEAADIWEALGMWLHAAECAGSASQAHLLTGSRRAAAASASRAEALLDHCDAPRPVGLTVNVAAPTLTRREREVALLAQSGLSSQAIAELLYLSVRTVESHLARTYHKLGIAGRRELSAALGALATR